LCDYSLILGSFNVIVVVLLSADWFHTVVYGCSREPCSRGEISPWQNCQSCSCYGGTCISQY